MFRFIFLNYTLLVLELLNFLGIEAVESARALSTSLGREIRPVLG
jgi:hypothetical protein